MKSVFANLIYDYFFFPKQKSHVVQMRHLATDTLSLLPHDVVVDGK